MLWNPAAEQITGVPGSEALGRTPLQVLGRSFEADEGALEGVGRLVAIRRGADEAWLSLSEAVMTDPAGAVAGRIFAFRDISAERAVEQMKSDFVSTVSHELRTPLTSIYGFAETLLRQDVLFGEEERDTFLRYIASESERLTAIVDRLLSVAQLDTGAMSVQIAETDVSAVVSEVVHELQLSLGDNGHRFVVSLPEERLAAEADRDKLGQVLAHLLDNAVRYSPAGGTVTVGARRAEGAVEVRVEDEGIGIPRAEHERIFRKFYRGEALRADHRRGRRRARPLPRPGAGDGHGRAGSGSTPTRVAARRSSSSCRPWGTETRGNGYTRPLGSTFEMDVRVTRVLVIDDEAPIRLLCRVNLEAEGMTVLEASDGPSGLAKAREELPDIVLLDVMMPGLDGWGVAEHMLEGEQTQRIPIIFLTARAEFRDRARGLDIGGVDYITKPFNPRRAGAARARAARAAGARRARRAPPREADRAPLAHGRQLSSSSSASLVRG